MAKWLAKEFDWNTGRYTGRYYDIAKAGIVAVFVDSFYGLNTNAGTAAAPFKTLGKAITTLNSTGADGSRIFMNGIFSETLPAASFGYQFIGCGGGKNGYVILWMNQATNARFIAPKLANRNTYIENVLFLGYSGLGFVQNLNDSTFRQYFLNIIADGAGIQNNSSLVFFYFSKIRGLKSPAVNTFTGSTLTLKDSLLIDPESTSGWVTAIQSYIRNKGALIVNKTNCLEDDIAQFINEGNLDYNVRITSPLLFSGPNDTITGFPTNIGGVNLGLDYGGLRPEFTETGGATVADLTLSANGNYTITPPATLGTLETALMDLGNVYPLENIDLFNVFDFLGGEITQGVFEDFVSPRMTLTIKLKYGLTSAEIDSCPWLLIEYGKQPTFSGTGASRVGNAADTFDPETFQKITCRYMKLFITLQDNS